MNTVKLARVGLHHFEEPCLSGTRGSGTIFFGGCNLKCLFCQNHEISRQNKGIEVNKTEFLRAVEYLVNLGAHNINLVTPSIYTLALVDFLAAVKQKFDIPVVWNSSGYETVANLKKLEGLVDVFLPDFKYSDNSLALEYSGAKNYFEVASAAVTEMRRQRPTDIFDADGIMKRGVIVRHLILPDALSNTEGCLKAIADIDVNMYVSLMSQYFPTEQIKNHSKLSRRLTQAEYDQATEYFFEAGLKNGFSQELDSAVEEYVPNFDLAMLKKIIE